MRANDRASAVTLDLDKSWHAFQADTGLKGLLDEANNQSLFPEDRTLRDRVTALTDLAEIQHIFLQCAALRDARGTLASPREETGLNGWRCCGRSMIRWSPQSSRSMGGA